MTRGKIVANFDDKMLVSVEFNGDMYVEAGGYGREVLDNLSEINNDEEFREFIQAFGSENFDNQWYDNGVRLYTNEDKNNMLNFCTKYFDNWFSDYVYLKNLGQEEMFIICSNKNGNKMRVKIDPNGIVVLNFGDLVEQYSVDYEILEVEEDESRDNDEVLLF